jgi:hypothetical protein
MRLPLSRSRWVELVGKGAQALGDDAIGTGSGLGYLPARLLLGVVDHLGSCLLGRLDDRCQALGGTAGQRSGLGGTLAH